MTLTMRVSVALDAGLARRTAEHLDRFDRVFRDVHGEPMTGYLDVDWSDNNSSLPSPMKTRQAAQIVYRRTGIPVDESDIDIECVG